MGLRPSQRDEDAARRIRGINDLDCVFNGAVELVVSQEKYRYSGMLPCFFFGTVSTLLRSIRSARITLGRVS